MFSVCSRSGKGSSSGGVGAGPCSEQRDFTSTAIPCPEPAATLSPVSVSFGSPPLPHSSRNCVKTGESEQNGAKSCDTLGTWRCPGARCARGVQPRVRCCHGGCSKRGKIKPKWGWPHISFVPRSSLCPSSPGDATELPCAKVGGKTGPELARVLGSSNDPSRQKNPPAATLF